MKLSELIESGLVKDDDLIKVIIPPVYTDKPRVRSGNWFHDHILDLNDREIWSIKYYSSTQTWVVSLRAEGGEVNAEN